MCRSCQVHIWEFSEITFDLFGRASDATPFFTYDAFQRHCALCFWGVFIPWTHDPESSVHEKEFGWDLIFQWQPGVAGNE